MESVDAKLRRAKEHFSAFQTDAAKFLEKARPHFIRKVNHECTEHWLVFYVEDPYPPIELSILIGDFLHNLRSALDNLVCGLVRTKNPMSTCAKRGFPIFKDRDKYLAERNNLLKGVPKDACTIIDTLQPSVRPHATQELDPLWILNTLCNRDKHRATNLTICYHKNVEIRIPLKNGGGMYVKLIRDIYAGDVDTVPLSGDPASIEDNVQMEIKGRSALSFHSTDPWSERSVDKVLVTCLEYVEDRVIARFKPFFN